MKDSTKRYLLIGGSILVLGGLAYWFYRSAKKKKELKASEEAAAAAVAAVALEAITQPSTTPSSTTAISAPLELNTTDKIKSFQDYMDTVGNWVKNSSGKYVKLNKGTGYGNFGPSTSSAWNAYGKQYIASLTATSDYDQFKKNVKEAQVKNSSDGTTYIVVPLSDNRFVEIYKNGRFWYNQFVPVGGKIVPKNLSKGIYSNSGRKLVVTEGNKKGSTFETSSFWDTVKLLK
jgi:hypothetical protein